MATFQPGVSGDDGQDWNGANFTSAGADVSLGTDSGVGFRNFIRFPNVTVPQGATITACSCQFNARWEDLGTTVNLNVYFHNADNAAAPTSTAELDTAFTNATAAVAWNNVPGWSADEAGADTTTPSLVSILQTVINRAGWSSGNALVLLIGDNGSSASVIRRPKTFDNAAGLPTLTIEYTVGGGGTKRWPSRRAMFGVG